MTEWLSLSPQRNLKRLTLNTVSHATLDPEMEGIKILGHFWVSWYNWSTNGRMFSSVTQSCPSLCDPMNCSLPGLPVHHQLPELAQTHVHRVRDAIQPSHPLSSPSPPTFNLSQHQGLFKWVSSSHQGTKGASPSASVLPMNTQDWSPLGWAGLTDFL